MTEDLINRITYYLSSGGLFNPELADHLAVRNLLMECREALAQPEQEPVIDQSAAVRIATVLGWTPPRQPLTKKEVDLILAKHELNYVRGKDRKDLLGAMRDVEAAHGIKEKA